MCDPQKYSYSIDTEMRTQCEMCTSFRRGISAHTELSGAPFVVSWSYSSLGVLAESWQSLIKHITLELTWQDIC